MVANLVCDCNHAKYGYRIEAGTATRRAEGSRHMLHSPRAWCIQSSVFYAHKDEVDTWVIVDVESGKCYSASTKQITKFAKPIERGAGQQLMLILEYWSAKNVAPGKEPVQLQLGW